MAVNDPRIPRWGGIVSLDDLTELLAEAEGTTLEEIERAPVRTVERPANTEGHRVTADTAQEAAGFPRGRRRRCRRSFVALAVGVARLVRLGAVGLLVAPVGDLVQFTRLLVGDVEDLDGVGLQAGATGGGHAFVTVQNLAVLPRARRRGTALARRLQHHEQHNREREHHAASGPSISASASRCIPEVPRAGVTKLPGNTPASRVSG